MILVKLLSKRALSQQARRPSGFIGRFIMSNIFKKGNNDLNCFVKETLELQPSNRVLEIGFGPGVLINKMASIISSGHIDGVDFSETMLAEAEKRNKPYILSNKVTIQKGDAKALNYPDNTFDRVCSVNTLYFWNPPEAYLSEILRVLKPNGRLVLGIRDAEQLETLSLDKNVFSIYSLNEAANLLVNAGFSNVQVQKNADVPFASYCVMGLKKT